MKGIYIHIDVVYISIGAFSSRLLVLLLFSYLPRLSGPALHLRYFTSWEVGKITRLIHPMIKTRYCKNTVGLCIYMYLFDVYWVKFAFFWKGRDHDHPMNTFNNCTSYVK